jgi:amino acid adenylation domain-containing protein
LIAQALTMRSESTQPYRILPQKYIPRQFVPFPNEALDGTLIDRFRVIVEKRPEHPAVVETGRVVSYRELDELSNQLSHAILSKRSVYGEPVVFFSDRTAASIITMLGILKAGGVYIAMDPSHPAERLGAILSDSGAGLLLSRTEHRAITDRLVSGSIQLIDIDELSPNHPRTLPAVSLQPDFPAVIFYTSGSTGNPKGVVRDHRAVLHWAKTAIATNYTNFKDRVVSPFPGGFSGSATAIFGTLLSGATLYPCDFSNQTLPMIIEWLVKEKITYLQIQLGLFHQLAESFPPNFKIIFPDLRWIATGGDTMSTRAIKSWMKHVGRKSILSYGLSSTEAGVITRQYYSDQTNVEENSTSVGYPVPGSEVSIVDQSGQEMAFNEVGQIKIRSQSVMNGYWHQVKETELSILTDPKNKSVRTFTSDDLGQLRPDGSLEFLGRADNMVKIRGYRVETMEIASTLAGHPAVKDLFIAVKTMPHKKDEKRLIAYINPRTRHEHLEKELREFLARRLPAYMLPARFVFLDKLPYNLHGKVDAHALPEPPERREGDYLAPRNKDEEAIAIIWCDLLGLESVGVEDNFFELGGDSLLALNMILEVEKLTGRAVARSFFQQATVAHLVGALGQDHPERGMGKIVSPSKGSTPPPASKNIRKGVRKKIKRFNLTRLATKDFWLDRVIEGTDMLYQRSLLSKPYIEGNQWLSQWCSRPLVAHGIYQAKYELFCQMIASLEGCTVDPNDAFPANLIGNILQGISRDYRGEESSGFLDKLRHSKFPYWSSLLRLIEDSPLSELDRYFSISGLEILEQAYRDSRGVILLTYHSTINRLAIATLPRRLNVEAITTISRKVAIKKSSSWQNYRPRNIPTADIAALSAGEALEGQRLLSQGKILQFVSDGEYQRYLGIEPSIVAGRRYGFSPGFAELALNTGAKIIPQYTTTLAAGKIHTTFLPPLVPEPGERGFQVRNLGQQYANFITYSWTVAPESIQWIKMQKHFNQPAAADV